MEDKLLYTSKRLLFFETVFFLTGIFIITVEPVAGIYYYFVFGILETLVNLITLMRLVMKRPVGFGYFIGLLIVVPALQVLVLFYIVRQMIA